MVQLIFQTLFVLGIVPFVLAVLWLLGVPYTRRAAQDHESELYPERNLDGARVLIAGIRTEQSERLL